jgi:hypothetical protein
MPDGFAFPEPRISLGVRLGAAFGVLLNRLASPSMCLD